MLRYSPIETSSILQQIHSTQSIALILKAEIGTKLTFSFMSMGVIKSVPFRAVIA